MSSNEEEEDDGGSSGDDYKPDQDSDEEDELLPSGESAERDSSDDDEQQQLSDDDHAGFPRGKVWVRPAYLPLLEKAYAKYEEDIGARETTVADLVDEIEAIAEENGWKVPGTLHRVSSNRFCFARGLTIYVRVVSTGSTTRDGWIAREGESPQSRESPRERRSWMGS